jgi:hypothetical protein
MTQSIWQPSARPSNKLIRPIVWQIQPNALNTCRLCLEHQQTPRLQSQAGLCKQPYLLPLLPTYQVGLDSFLLSTIFPQIIPIAVRAFFALGFKQLEIYAMSLFYVRARELGEQTLAFSSILREIQAPDNYGHQLQKIGETF